MSSRPKSSGATSPKLGELQAGNSLDVSSGDQSVKSRLSPVTIGFLLLTWIATVAVKGIWLAGDILGPPFSATPARSSASREFVVAFLLVVALCCLSSFLTWVFFRRYALLTLPVIPVAIVVTISASTNSELPLLTALLLLVCALIIGLAIVTGCTAASLPLVIAAAIALAAGVGVIGVSAFVLALTSSFRIEPLVLLLALIVLTAMMIVVRSTRSKIEAPQVHTGPSGYELLVASLAVGIFTFAVLAAFVPENQTDATRQHLPIAREIWQTGAVGVFDPMTASRQAVQGHVLYALAYGLGGVTAAKLLQVIYAVGSVLAIAGIGQCLAGRTAAFTGAVIFSTMPIVLWETGHAFNDLLPVQLVLAAVLCLLIWQAQKRDRWLILAGALTAIGISAKLNVALFAPAIFLAILLFKNDRWSFRDRFHSMLAYVVGSLIILPWTLRLATVNPQFMAKASPLSSILVKIPLLDRILESAPDTGSFSDSVLSVGVDPFAELNQSFGHSPPDLLGMPWFLTFQGKDLGFPIIGRGEIGIALLMLLPVIAFAPRTRATAMVGFITLISFIAWWATPFQIARHLLPTLALASALTGAGVAGLFARPIANRMDRTVVLAVRGGLLLSLILVPFFFLPSSRTQIPISYLIGAESREDYINRTIRSAVVLQAATDFLPPDTPVVYYGGPWEAPQLYTEARLIFSPSYGMENDARAVLMHFDELGATHFIWNRADSLEVDWRSPTLSTPFLRQYARILAGDDDAYLFEVLPAGSTTWGQADVANLLDDPVLQDVKSKNGPWKTDGKSVIAKGVVALSRRATLMQEVDVTAGHAYLLQAPVRCLDASGRGIFTFRWLDAEDNVIDVTTEQVLPGQEVSEQFLWRRAPDGAASVQAEFSMAGPSRCEYSGAALYDLG